jgi:uncharacterized protein YjdB
VAVGQGVARIEALAARKADTAEVLVRQVVAAVQVTPDSITIEPQADTTLTAIASDANGFPVASAQLVWTSDGPAVATVTDGVVTGVANGTTTIRATVDGVADTTWVKVEAAHPFEP